MDVLAFSKGHGTGNDFVVLPDPDGELTLTASLVAAICDRRRGVGADGVLRVVRAAAVPEAAGNGAGAAEWFMDYRNADGSLAAMCGNGARVFGRYLVEAGLVPPGPIPVLTRSGPIVLEVDGATVAVQMPMPGVAGRSTVTLPGGDTIAGRVASCGNPNLVCRVADPGALDLAGPLRLDPSVFPDGANVEFVQATGAAALAVAMRVVERGVGETRSCGSGACAVAAVVLLEAGLAAGTVTVHVPGGQLTVAIDADRCVLAGPAVIVASGEIRIDELGR